MREVRLSFGGQARRAREELERALESITYRLDHLESAPAPEYDLDKLRGIMAGVSGQAKQRLDELDSRVLGLSKEQDASDQHLKDLTFAVAEGIERVSRAERRIHATIKRARKELADHGFESPGLETEAAELRSVDGDRGADGKVPAVPETVEAADDAPSSIRGVSAGHLRRVRGW